MKEPKGWWTIVAGHEVQIRRTRTGRWTILWDGERLGTYRSPAAALDDLVGGHVFPPSSGIDPASLPVPDDLADWHQLR